MGAHQGKDRECVAETSIQGRVHVPARLHPAAAGNQVKNTLVPGSLRCTWSGPSDLASAVPAVHNDDREYRPCDDPRGGNRIFQTDFALRRHQRAIGVTGHTSALRIRQVREVAPHGAWRYRSSLHRWMAENDRFTNSPKKPPSSTS